jgi:ethanolamine utilization protein EutQ (cupin superfamily)
MPIHISSPSVIPAAGTTKMIREYVGRVNTRSSVVSIAHMQSPRGWSEPGQTPDFDEYTVVLHGMLQVTHHDGILRVHAGEGVITRKGEWVQYSTPGDDGAEYVAVCLPAFSLEAAHRDDDGLLRHDFPKA